MVNDVRRLRYFNGLFLKEDEFNLEQNYHIRMRRLHNRWLHSYGIVYGLTVTKSAKPGAGPRDITISKGMALNKVIEDGEEVSKEIIRVDDTIDYTLSGTYAKNQYAIIYIRYPKPETKAQKDADDTEMIHWSEKPIIGDVLDGTVINLEENIRLAKVHLIELGDGTIAIDPVIDLSDRVRTYAGFSGSSLTVNGNAGIGTVPNSQLGRLLIEDSAVPLALRETGIDVNNGGLWRIPLDGGTLRFDVNTGTAGNEFGTGKFLTPLTITKDGKVGILTAPSNTLDVNGDIRVRGGDIKDSYGYTRISLPANGDLELMDAGENPRITIVDNGNLVLKKNSGDAALTIDTVGKVGILTVPSDTLDVNGDLRVRGGNIKDSTGIQRISMPANGNLDLKDAGGTSRITIVDNGNLELKKDGGTAALTIDNLGHVSIGVPNQTGNLHVHGTMDNYIMISSNSPTASKGLEFYDTSGNHSILQASITSLGPSFFIPNALKIKTEVSGAPIILETNSGEKLRITDDGRVGIGTPVSDAKLHVHKASAGTVSAYSQSVAVLESDSNAFLQMLTPDDKSSAVFFGDVSNTIAGYVWYTHYNDTLYFGTNGTSRMIINGSGNVGIGTDYPGDDKLDVRGRCYSSGGWQTTNADYSEYFESADSAAISVATPVLLTNEGTVRAAKKGEVPIGIVTENSAVVGNSYKEWPKKYLRDKYGRLIMEKVKEEMKLPKKEIITKEHQKVKKEEVTEEVIRPEVVQEEEKYIRREKVEQITRQIEVPLFEEVDLYDATGKIIIGKHRVPVMETYEEEVDVLDENGLPVLTGSGQFVTVERPKLNPEYDETKKYIPRSERPEWSCIGLLGQIPLRKGKPVAPTWIKIKDLSDDVELWLVK